MIIYNLNVLSQQLKRLLFQTNFHVDLSLCLYAFIKCQSFIVDTGIFSVI